MTTIKMSKMEMCLVVTALTYYLEAHIEPAKTSEKMKDLYRNSINSLREKLNNIIFSA